VHAGHLSVRQGPWRISDQWPTTAGPSARKRPGDVPVGCRISYLAGLLKLWLDRLGSVGLEAAPGHQGPQSASGSRPDTQRQQRQRVQGCSRRASGRVAYCLAWAPSCRSDHPPGPRHFSALQALEMAAGQIGWMAEPLIHSVRWRGSVPQAVASPSLVPGEP